MSASGDESLMEMATNVVIHFFNDCCPSEDSAKKLDSTSGGHLNMAWQNHNYYGAENRTSNMHGYFRQRQYNAEHNVNGTKLPRPLYNEKNNRKLVHSKQPNYYYTLENPDRGASTISQEAVLEQPVSINSKSEVCEISKPVGLPAALVPNHSALAKSYVGLKGSRPLVRLDRLSLLSKHLPTSPESAVNSNDSEQSTPTLMRAAHLIERKRSVSDASSVTDVVGASQGSGMRGMTLTVPSLAFKDLRLTHVIGGGGFGQVWQAEWKGTPVAVKVLSNICQTSLPEHVLTAFEEEVAMLAALRHPNICLFLGVCLEQPNRTIVTELVLRGSLWDVLRMPNLFQQQQLNMSSASCRSPPAVLRGAGEFVQWPAWAVRKVLEGTCRGLIYLHGCDPAVIHRDLKSANLLLDESLNVKICDFGLARLRDYTTVLTANVGTIQWMAPEVLVGSAYNESADVYSLGIVMWELFTGRCPYEGMAQMEVAIAVTHKGTRPAQPISCSTMQWNLMNQCWATDPTARLTAPQLLKELDIAFPST